MTLQEIQNSLATIKRGRITKVRYVTIKGNYTKETETLVRFVDYDKINGVQVKGKSNPNESYVKGYKSIIYNSNTQQHYLAMATIKTAKNKSKVKYYCQGQEIDKATYDKANPSKPFNTPWFKKNIKDIISLG